MAGPHEGQPVLHSGESLEQARAAMILIHGRGASAADIMTIAAEVMFPGVAYLAPQAAGSAWYPNPFTAPFEANEPYLSSALHVLSSLVAKVGTTVPAGRLVLLGFSQGACLALEFGKERVIEAGQVFERMGADVTVRLYPRMGHTSNADEIEAVRAIVKGVAG